MISMNSVQAVNSGVSETREDSARSDEDKRIREEEERAIRQLEAERSASLVASRDASRDAESKKETFESENRGNNIDETA